MLIKKQRNFCLQPVWVGFNMAVCVVQSSWSIGFLTHQEGNITYSSIICKHIRPVQRQQHLSRDTVGGVKRIPRCLRQLLTKRRKRSPDMNRTRQQTLPPPGFIRKVTKDWLLQWDCRTSREGTTSSYSPRNTQIQIRYIFQTCKKKNFATVSNYPPCQGWCNAQLWSAAAAVCFS